MNNPFSLAEQEPVEATSSGQIPPVASGRMVNPFALVRGETEERAVDSEPVKTGMVNPFADILPSAPSVSDDAAFPSYDGSVSQEIDFELPPVAGSPDWVRSRAAETKEAWDSTAGFRESALGSLGMHPMAATLGMPEMAEGAAMILDTGALAPVFGGLDMPVEAIRSVMGYLQMDVPEFMYFLKDLEKDQRDRFAAIMQEGLETGGAAGKVAYALGHGATAVADAAAFLSFLKIIGIPYGGMGFKGGAGAMKAGKGAMAMSTALHAGKIALFKSLLQSEDATWGEKANIAMLSFLYSATPALSGFAPDKLVFVSDMALNSIITALKDGGYKDKIDPNWKKTGNIFKDDGRTQFEQLVDVMKEGLSDVVFSAMTKSFSSKQKAALDQFERRLKIGMEMRQQRIDAATQSVGELMANPNRTPEQNAELNRQMAVLEKNDPKNGLVKKRVEQVKWEARELSKKPVLEPEERQRLDAAIAYLHRMSPEHGVAAETSRLRSDVNELSRSDPLILSPELVKTASEAELRDTAAALSALYGRGPENQVTPRQIKDAFSPRLQKVLVETERQAKERESTEMQSLLASWVKGEVTGQEMMAALGKISEEALSEFQSRTTGDSKEMPRAVLKDIVSRYGTEAEAKEAAEKVEAPAAEAPEAKPAPAVEAPSPAVEAPKADAGRPVADAGRPVVPPEAPEAKPSLEAKPSPKPDVAIGDRIYEHKDGKWYNKKTGTEVKNKAILAGIDNKLAKGNVAVADEVGRVEAAQKPLKTVAEPDPKTSIEKWRAALDNAARVAAGDPSYSRNDFIADMEGRLHPKADIGDIAIAYDAAKDAADRVERFKETVPQLPSTRIKGQIMPKEQPVEAKGSAIIRAMMKAMEKGSQAGWRAAIKQMRELSVADRKAVRGLMAELQESLNELEGATRYEKERLRHLITAMKGTTAKTRDTQMAKFFDTLETIKDNIDARAKTWELRPYPEAVTQSGVDKNSSYQEIREVFIKRGGDPAVSSATKMLDYLNGSDQRAATMDVQGDIDSLRGRKEARRWIIPKVVNLLHQYQSGRNNLYDMINIVSRGAEGTALSLTPKKLAFATRGYGENMARLGDILEKMNPKGVHSNQIVNKKVKVTTPNGKKAKMALGEIIMIDMALDVPDNRNALIENRFQPDKDTSFSFEASEADYRRMVKDALAQATPEERKAYEEMKRVYARITRETGAMLKAPVERAFKALGIERELDWQELYYVPIKVADMEHDRMGMKIQLPDGEPMAVGDNFVWGIVNKASMQERKGGSKGGRITVGNIDKVLSDMVENAASFAAKSDVQIDLMRMIGNKDLRNAIAETFSSRFLNNMTEAVKNVTGSMAIRKSDGLDKFTSKVFSVVDITRLGRPSTQYIMASSLQLARPYLYSEMAMVPGMTHSLNREISERFEKDGFSSFRYKYGGFSPEFMEIRTKLKEISGGKTYLGRSRQLMGMGDKVALRTIYSTVAFDMLSREGKAMTMDNLKKQGEDFWQRVGQEYAYVALRTQPSGDPSAVSVWKGRAAHHLGWRILTRYGTQGSRIYNNVLDAYDAYAYNPTPENRELVGRTVNANIIVNIGNLALAKTIRHPLKFALLASVLYAIGREDESEEAREKAFESAESFFKSYIEAWAGGAVKTVEFADDIYSIAQFLVNRNRSPGLNVADAELETAAKFVQATVRANKWRRVLNNNEYGRGDYSHLNRKRTEKLFKDAVEASLVHGRDVLGIVAARPEMATLRGDSIFEGQLAEWLAETMKK